LCEPNRSATIKAFSSAPMDNHFKRITDLEALDALIERSRERPLVIFKHSLTCSISGAAHDQMEQYEGEVALIEVQRARGLSSAIESRFGVAHESPQVIVLRKGQVFWNASHFKITAEAVARAVREAGEAT
jgi:bacillithiol system protein YtxJ